MACVSRRYNNIIKMKHWKHIASSSSSRVFLHCRHELNRKISLTKFYENNKRNKRRCCTTQSNGDKNACSMFSEQKNQTPQKVEWLQTQQMYKAFTHIRNISESFNSQYSCWALTDIEWFAVICNVVICKKIQFLFGSGNSQYFILEKY